MVRPLLPGLAALALWTTGALAQDWASAEVCTVETAEIVADVFAPKGLDALEAEAADIANANGRFWRITSPEGAVSHLWGTFHSADRLILRLPDEVTEAISAARMVAVEVDYTFKSRDGFRDAQMMEGRFKDASDPFAFEPGDGSIAGLPQEVSGWIRDRALELGWTEDVDLVLSLPGMAEMLLSDPCEDFTQGVLPIQDDYIQLLGRLAGAEILGLEAPDEFITDLDARPETAQAIVGTYAAYLKPAETNAERATSFALYLEGRLGLMQAWDYDYQQQIYGPDGLDLLQLTDEYLLEFRNVRFLERLTQDLQTGGVFVAVGAAHIPGPAGLVALLEEAGYTVTRIPLPGEAS
jgi:uncharacterized protein YbaP (TraB family)